MILSFKQLKKYIQGQEYFAIFSLPESSKVIFYLGEGKDLENTFVFAPYDQKEHSVVEFSPRKIVFSQRPEATEPNRGLDLNFADTSNYKAKISLVLEALEKRNTDKVVLSRSEKFKTNRNHEEIFLQLLSNYPKAMVYWVKHPSLGNWMGASPEKFLSTNKSFLSTVSLAGTKLDIGQNNPEWGTKEQEEQAYVSKYILEVLKKYGNHIDAEGPRNVRAGKLWHLKTDFKMPINTDVDIPNLIEELHPTPAVCGLPKNTARQIISDYEAYDRRYYTGYFGPKTNTQTSYFVNLRCMSLDADTIEVFVGGGITKDSDVDKEFEETVQKTRTMLQVI